MARMECAAFMPAENGARKLGIQKSARSEGRVCQSVVLLCVKINVSHIANIALDIRLRLRIMGESSTKSLERILDVLNTIYIVHGLACAIDA